ncbi:MAG: insulinase family protein, partial [Campylobacter sp.]|nr:insulinase family protein [Campylobacter sp.]
MILEEAKRVVGTRLYEKRAEYIYPGSIYAKRFPIGKNEIIANADRATLLGFYKRMYQPKFMSVVVVGDIDETKTQNLIKEYFSDLKNADEPIRADKTLMPFKEGFANLSEKESGKNLVNIMFASDYEPLNSQNALKKAYLNRYVASLLSLSYDKLNVTLKSPIKGNFVASDLFKQRALNSFSANIIDKDTNATLNSLFSAIKGVREFGFSKDDFESIKKEFTKQNLTEFSRSDTQTQGVYGLLNFVWSGSVKLSKKDKYELGTKMLNLITLDEINEHFKTITNGDKFVEFMTTEPLKITQSEIDEIYEKATPYDFSKDLAMQNVLLSEIPAKIAPSKDEFDKENEIYILEFPNGANVLLKDIKTIKNQIQFSAVKKGGTTNLPSKQQAGIAFAVLNSGTIGDLGKYEADKLTSGFSYSLKAGMSQALTSVSGSASSADFENLLQEFFIKFNNPKLHESEFELYKQRAKTDIAKRNEMSGYRFSKEILENFYGGNERAMPLEISDLDEANLANLQDIVNESFANAADFIFMISGDLDIAKTKDLLGIYVANLKGEKT